MRTSSRAANQLRLRRFTLTLATISAAALAFNACGGGTSDTTPTTPVEQPTTGGLTGKVVDADSSSGGVAGVSIQLSMAGTTKSATTGANGDFTVTALDPGAWTVQMTLPANRLLAANETGTRTATVVAGNNSTSVSSFRLSRPTGTVSGSVKNGANGVSALLNLTRAGFTTLSVTADAAGSFTVSSVPIGTWSLALTVPSGTQLAANETGTRSVAVAAGQTTQVSQFNLQTQVAQLVSEIHISGASFSPANATVAAGTTVKFINDDAGSHTITPQNTSQPGVFPRTVFGGSTGVVLEHTFNTPGQVYRYRCELHSDNFTTGMVGTITVQ